MQALKPLFFGRAITYVDAGAYTGEVFELVGELGPQILDAHLIEANPETFATLTKKFASDRRAVTHHTALGDAEGSLRFELRGTMSRVVSDEHARTTVTVPTTTLDALMAREKVTHIDLLKIDVEGSELRVLAGAAGLLAANAIDVIYIEAGMSGDSTQQVHHREIEDALEPHGYRLMGVYEQTHEWIEDLPTLRRANLAFISLGFAQSHPYRLSRELVKVTESASALEAERDALKEQLSASQERAERYRNRAERNAEALTRAQTSQFAMTLESGTTARLEAERDAYARWGAESNARLRRVLGSRWWRLTRIPRGVTRRARAALGKSNHAPITPVPRPALASTPSRAAAAGSQVSAVSAAVKSMRVGTLVSHIRELERESADPNAWLILQYARISFDSLATAYANVVAHADAIVDRRGSLDVELAGVLGAPAYRAMLTNVAKAYGRLGRPDAAIAPLDVAIAGGHRELRVVRAEVAYPTNPTLAIDDLTTYLATASATHPLRAKAEFLLAHLQLDGTGPTAGVEITRPEIHVAFAIDAQIRGDALAYAEHMDAFFEAHGLAPVVGQGTDAIAGDRWSSPDVPASTHEDLVTVVVTAYNAERTIESALASLQRQSHANLEILVVDDHSTDGTLSVVHDIAAKDARVRVLRTDHNSGTYVAKNLAIEAATGAFVTFHDSDDWAHPQRIERHLTAMAEQPSLVATRSDWLRVTPAGVIEVRRWGMTASHPNPASVFIRREAFETVGVFDTVRFGADSEFWFRLRAILPAKSASSLRMPLGIGRHHDESLTRAGAGAWTTDHYSAVRSAYQLSWTEHHAMSATPTLVLRADKPRAFWAPDVMLREPDEHPLPATRATSYPVGDEVPPFVFAISLASRAAATDWSRAVELIDRTLHSIIGQSDPRWTAIVCGHERPDLPGLDDPRVTFIASPQAPPTKRAGFRADKNFKRRIIAGHARGLGAGYFFPLDADDLVHRDVVAHARRDDNRRGYVATQGYAEDFTAGRIAPIPGAWTLAFDRVCGSAIVLYFDREDLPRWPSQTDPTYFDLFSHHAYWAGTAEEYRGPLDPIPFPAGVYVLNTRENLSFQLQRANRRSSNIIDAIQRHALEERFTLLRDEFGQR